MSYSNGSNALNSLGWLFPSIGVPVLVAATLLASTRAKDAWILQNILPAFIFFGILLGISLLRGSSTLGVLNAGMALGMLAVLPSLKYGFVYGEFDSIGHYSTALEISRTGSISVTTVYSEVYGATPLSHILLAMASLVTGLPIEGTMVFVLFLVYSIILVLVVESCKRMFPHLDRRLLVLLAMTTLPVYFFFVGATYGYLMLAILIYMISMIMTSRLTSRDTIVTAILMLSLVFSHFVTSIYFMIALTGYVIFALVLRRFARSSSVAGDDVIRLVPRFLLFFLFWLTYVGQNVISVLAGLSSGLFQQSPLPSSAEAFSPAELLQIFVMQNGRLLFSFVVGLGASVIVLLSYRTNWRKLMLWWCLLATSLIFEAIVSVGYKASQATRFMEYTALITPYFVSFYLVARSKDTALPSPFQMRAIKGAVMITLVVLMVATYPITPLYPKSDGTPVLDDNSVNSVYAISGIEFFSSVYSDEFMITSVRIESQILSLHPDLVHLEWYRIIPELDYVRTPAELKGELVVFDEGGRSGTANLAMRALAPDLRDQLGIVYSNGFFYVAIAI